MAIKYFTEDCNYRLEARRAVREWLHAVALEEGYRVEQINYIFCSAQHLLEMNRQFLGHDYFTDIITFDYSDLEPGVVSGDIFIDVETVADNARIYGTTARQEMLRVVVHGVLHLCGQKDKEPDDEAEMHRKEDKYLAIYNAQ